ncbi:MAG: NAD-dependent epimerase/dehydratase family protein [Flavobacteriales bacterium]|nr:NAD-dependent epimerase/dehydratase family protein [Flavobacteriales bacterium]MCB9190869.1 NAD-dependent epimerase/dehydratase family protein [Flavobacteriales bacterium]MCB9204837.1 NAD-dependent epimerase/dehydratase family protein [Flavobacteriales bacterium]
MTTIDRSKPVMVTGATGYVAGWLVKKLLEEGLTVHAAVRDPKNKTKLAHLDELAAKSSGSIKYYKADLLQPGSYAEAMEGCELVYHTASPYTLNVKDPQKELIDPALKGTQNVLAQASKTPSVKRVVLTSSCAAIYTDATDCQNAPNGVLTEAVWNTTASLNYQPYSYSKTLAEKEAWKMAEAQGQWDLVVVNPCGVFGPALNASSSTSESTNLMKQLADGTMKMGVPNIGIGVVDVRDLAEAHFAAGFNPEANGRNIIAGHNTSFLKMAQILHDEYEDKYPVPNKALPKWLLSLVGPMVNKAITRPFVKKNVNVEWKADNAKSKRELGITYRPLEETLVDDFQALINAKVI